MAKHLETKFSEAVTIPGTPEYHALISIRKYIMMNSI